MLRSISKVAGTAAAAAVASVSSPAVAQVDPAAAAAARQRDASRLPKPSSGPHYVDDEYDFCHEEVPVMADPFAQFGGVPSQEEADEAARELKATFVQKDAARISSPRSPGPTINDGPCAEAGSVSMTTATQRSFDVQELSTTPTNQIISSTAEHNNALAFVAPGGSHVVSRCIDLLQTDPDIQAAVVSLARDPAIWDAFVKNEKVQELMRARTMGGSHNGGYEGYEGYEDFSSSSSTKQQPQRANPFLVAFNCLRNVVWEMMDAMVDLINGVFGFVDRKVFGDKDSDPTDVPFKACMVLTILVLALVVLKRNPSPLG